jgi:hypothetical protein
MTPYYTLSTRLPPRRRSSQLRRHQRFVSSGTSTPRASRTVSVVACGGPVTALRKKSLLTDLTVTLLAAPHEATSTEYPIGAHIAGQYPMLERLRDGRCAKQAAGGQLCGNFPFGQDARERRVLAQIREMRERRATWTGSPPC